MFVSTAGIVLRLIKYGDNNAICHILTEALGRESFMIRLSKNTKQGKATTSLFQASSIIQVNFNFNELKKIHHIKETEWLYIYKNTHQDVHKNCIALFIVDMVCQSISHPEKNEQVFDFVKSMLMWNDVLETQVAKQIPLFFVCHFLKILGHDFSESVSEKIIDYNKWQHIKMHDLLENMQLLNQEVSLNGLSKININANNRRACFDVLLWHFIMLLPNFKMPPSLSIIKEILYKQ